MSTDMNIHQLTRQKSIHLDLTRLQVEGEISALRISIFSGYQWDMLIAMTKGCIDQRLDLQRICSVAFDPAQLRGINDPSDGDPWARLLWRVSSKVAANWRSQCHSCSQ